MQMRTLRQPRPGRARSRGQVVVIFAGAMILFVGLCAIVIDVSWYWANTLRMQRAADAAALAGVIWLPGNVTTAASTARAEAAKNGYTNGVGGVTVTPTQDSVNNRRLKVHLEGDVGTFFARAVGISKWHASVDSKAEYVLPVPMGSPENYYGVFGLTRGLTTSETDVVNVDTPTNNVQDTNNVAATPTTNTSGDWRGISNSSTTANYGINTVLSANETDNATSSSARVAATQTANGVVTLGGFNLTGSLAANEDITNIDGIQVLLDDAYLSATCANTRIAVALSYNGGTTWTSSTQQTATLTTSTVDTTLGSLTSLAAWTFSPSHTWSANDISNSNFKVRLTAIKGSCSTVWVKLDQLRVSVQYDKVTHTTQTVVNTTNITDQNLKGPGSACPMGVSNCYLADGTNLNPRGFWGTMNTQGAENVNGDAFQPFYDTATGGPAVSCSTAGAGRACYDATNYYNYAVEMPSGSSGGSVYVYDPNFCSVSVDKGTGDRWWTNGGAVTSTYELYDTKNTLYDQSDDTLLATSGNLFKNMSWSDQSMGGANSGSDCKNWSDQTYGDGRDYHNHWYKLYTGMTGGVGAAKVYRVHTTSTDPNNVNAQKTINGENSFALYASASGATPRLYGIGAMQAFTPLSASGGTVTSEFYLAQIDAVHAGKTLQISLWDPGDTSPLTADISILIPTSSGWTATPVTYSATQGTTNSGRADGSGGKPNCATNSRTTASTSPINTFTNGGNSTGKFNGCWLTIVATIPTTYDAQQQGWWKIRYTMTGTGTSNDVTTWKADIRGNPVHLVLP
jgi:hypothetical protein